MVSTAGGAVTQTAALRVAGASTITATDQVVTLNNAANDRRHSLESVTPESWDAGLAVNLKHQFFAAQAVLPDMQAAGGGVITAATVYIKFFIAGAHLSRFTEGLFASINYAVSFLGIHFAHFTLATKQPAMTAPALAHRLDQVSHDAPGRRLTVVSAGKAWLDLCQALGQAFDPR